MDPIFELAIRLPPEGSRDLLRALHRQLRAAIVEGRLRPGLRLPPTRVLAATLGVSRNTTVAAYDLLLSEGYLTARPGAGTYVADHLPQRPQPRPPTRPADDRRLAGFRGAPAVSAERLPDAAYRYDFRLGVPDGARLPFHIWRRLSARALGALSRMPPAYAPADGQPALREAIAKHVSFTRAVACGADDIVVTAGAQQAFDLLARILVAPGRTIVALEDPGYPPLRAAFAAAGAEIVAIPVDDDGLRVDRLPTGTRVICVTPSHQFPIGVAMSAPRRAALLDFAAHHRAVVIEDDYDSEFRFGGRPLDALQTLDRAEAVFYVGTFSKSLFPALRLGFVVPPPWARPALVAAKQAADWHNPVLAQETLAAFITEGHLARHVRQMRKIYGARRQLLLQALERHLGDRLTPIPSAAGLHLAARLDGRVQAQAIVEIARTLGIGLESLDKYARLGPAPNGLAFGFGAIGDAAIEPAIGILARRLA